MIVQTDIHDRLELPTDAPIGKRNLWEKVPNLLRTYDPVLKRIRFLVGKGLMLMMVPFDFLSQRQSGYYRQSEECEHYLELWQGEREGGTI
jgi:hypothetical protein